MVTPEIEGVSNLELIGKGGQSVVYKGWQEAFDRFVAVKILNIDDETAAKRFNSEQKAMGRLSTNSGVVTVFNTIAIDDGRPALIMPFFENGSVADLLTEGGMPWREAVELVSSVSATIASAHDLGVIHRDLKPANILLDSDQQPLVADFGIAKLATDSTASQSTSLSFTPVYSPPESFSSGRPTKATDVYGLGATLWALLAGHAPYRSPGEAIDMMVLFNRVINEPLGQPNEGLPAGLEAVLERAVAKDPEHRFADASHFAQALNAVLDDPEATPDIAMPVAHPDLPATDDDVEPVPLETPSGPPRLESTTVSGVVAPPPSAEPTDQEGDIELSLLDGEILTEQSAEDDESKRGWALPAAAFAAALLVAVLGGVLLTQLGGDDSADDLEVASSDTSLQEDASVDLDDADTGTDDDGIEPVSDDGTDPLGPSVIEPGDDEQDERTDQALEDVSGDESTAGTGGGDGSGAPSSSGGSSDSDSAGGSAGPIESAGNGSGSGSGSGSGGSDSPVPEDPELSLSSARMTSSTTSSISLSVTASNCSNATFSAGGRSATSGSSCSRSLSGTITGLSENTPYTVTIRVTDQFDQVRTTTVSARTIEEPGPTTPELEVTSASGSATGPTTATVTVRTNNCATFTTANGNSSTSCSRTPQATLTGLTPGTSHTISINVTDEFGQGDSTTVTFSTPAEPVVATPLEIVMRRASAQSQTAGFVGLDTNQCVTAVFTYQWNSTTRSVTGCTTTPGISITGLTAGTRYTVSVRITDEFGQVLTDSLSFVTQPAEVVAEGISINSISFGGSRVCSQTPFTATASVSGSPVSWNWNSGRLHIDNWQAAGSATLRPDVVAGTWPVTLTVTNAEGVSATRTFNLTVLDDGNGCPGMKTR